MATHRVARWAGVVLTILFSVVFASGCAPPSAAPSTPGLTPTLRAHVQGETPPAIAYSSRCRANYQQGKFDQAITDCSRAIELDPRAAEAYLHRGLAFRDKGQKPKAVQDFETFLQLSDNPMDRMQVEQLMNKIR